MQWERTVKCEKKLWLFLSYFKLVLLGFRVRKSLLCCSNDNLNIRKQKLSIYAKLWSKETNQVTGNYTPVQGLIPDLSSTQVDRKHSF